MAATFPTSPVNGETAEVGGRYYTWNSTSGVWENTGAASTLISVGNLSITDTVTATTANVGNVDAGGTVTATTANIGDINASGNVTVTGTVTATTANVGDINASGTVTATTANVGDLGATGNVTVTGTVTANAFLGDGSNLTGITGGGFYKGNNGSRGDELTGTGDIFRINSQTLTANVTISSTENASFTGPLTIDDGVVLTVEGNLSII